MADEEQELDDFIEVHVTVLEVRRKYCSLYCSKLPSAQNRAGRGYNKLLWEEHCEGSTLKLHVLHGFAKKCDTLDYPLPAIAHLPFIYDCCFTIFVSSIFLC